MRAIILAAGHGHRMRPLTDTVHKTLLEVGGQTILGRIVTGLSQAGVSEIYVVTGYRADEVEGYLGQHHPEVPCRFVRNERYRETNNIHSMALAFEHLPLDQDVILVESDLVCEAAIFERIVKTPHANAALVDRYRAGMDGTVVTVEGGLITSVIPPHQQSGEFSFADKYKTLNIYKLSREFCRTSFRALLAYYATVDDSCYYELVLGILVYLKKASIAAEIIQGERWAEIDDPNDLRIAEFTFNPAAQRRILEATTGGYWSFPITDFCFLRNMYFPTPSMMAELRNNLAPLVHNYGSRQDVLDRKLAVFLLCAPERVHVLNGASQVYPILAARFAGQRVLVPEPTFGEYRRSFPEHLPYPDRMGVDLEDLERRAEAADVVVFVNPNNPTGTLLSTAWIFRFAEERPGTRVIVDESFLAFTDEPSMISLLEQQPLSNVIVLTSLSKSLGIPGVRLGHVYTCDSALGADIARALPIWNLNSLAEHVLEIALKHRPGLAASLRATAADRALFAESLAGVVGVAAVHAGGGNFILVTLRAGLGPADVIVDRLLNRHALYVKDVSDRFPGGQVHLRFAVRLPEENQRLCAALAEELAARRIDLLPAALSPRPATSADYELYLRFFRELGLPDDPIPDRALWEAEWLPHTFFLERDGVPVGYAAARVLGAVGHLRHVVTAPEARRGGVGRALMKHLAARLRAAGCTRWVLNAKADNTTAISLYERCGMTVAYRSVALALDWSDVAALPRDAAEVLARPIAPDEDAAIEAAFAIPPGRLADRRAEQGNVLLRLVDRARPDDPRVGVACVDPAFPGAFPFKVARPELAAPLLDAVRAQMRPSDVFVRLVIESDDALDTAMRAAGARVKFVLAHMSGDIPAAGGDSP